jgi:hypothetical protein
MKIQDYLLVGIVAAVLLTNIAPNFYTKVSDVQLFVDVVASTPELDKVKEEFNKIESKEDKLLIYKLFAGASEYLAAAETLQSTNQFDPILGKVQTSYGWNREKYSKFTDAVSEYLVSVGYDEPKALSSSVDRKEFAKIFKNLAEAIK